MNNFFLLLIILGFLGAPICIIISILQFVKKKRGKPFLIGVGCFLALFIIGFVGFGITMVPTSSSKTVENTETKANTTSGTLTAESTTVESTTVESTTVESTTVESTTAAPSQEELFVDTMTKNVNVSADVANSVYGILHTDMGFENISIEENTNIGNSLFKVTADGYTLKVTASDKLYKVLCGSYTMYSDDTFYLGKKDLEDRTIGNNDTDYYVIATEIVKQNLKNPSSAKFSSVNDCKMQRNGEYVAVKGYVNALNALNSTVQSEFLVEFKVIDLTTYSYETVYINIDGTTSGTFIDLN